MFSGRDFSSGFESTDSVHLYFEINDGKGSRIKINCGKSADEENNDLRNPKNRFASQSAILSHRVSTSVYLSAPGLGGSRIQDRAYLIFS